MTDAIPEPSPPTRGSTRASARAAQAAAQAAAQGAAETATLPVSEMPMRPLLAVAVVALAGLLTVTAFAGPAMVALALALAAGVIAWGWCGLLGLPSPRGTSFVLALGSVAAVGTVLATTQDPYLVWLPAAMAGAMIVAFIHQLARRDGRPRLVESIASTVTAIAIVVSGASLVALPRTEHGAWVVAIASAAVAVSAVTDLAAGSRRFLPWLLPLAMFAGGFASVVVGHWLGAVGWGVSALLGVLAAGISHAVRRVLATLPAIRGARSQLVSACASVLTGGMVVYVVGRLLVI